VYLVNLKGAFVGAR